MAPHSPAATIESHGCSVVLRCVYGPEALELFLSCQPAEVADAGRQAEAIYRAILGVLKAEGGTFASVVSETVFLRNLRADFESVREARHRVLAAFGEAAARPAITEIEQAPLNEKACLEVSLQAVIPNRPPLQVDSIEVKPRCGCAECARAHGLRIHIGDDEARFYAGGLCGAGESAYEQTLAMFGLAEDMLRQAGLEFSDVVRTWIYLREMDRDYADLNRARREFFTARGIQPVPASTAIGGAPVSARHDLSLSIYAARGREPVERTVMTSPTLNEAPEYGADFVRGLRIADSNKITLIVSGTASVDEAGATAHVGDFAAQVERMLLNLSTLLAGQGAGFGDVVSAITYVKHRRDAVHLRDLFQRAGFEGFPQVFVEADVCRPDLLCETELIAALPGNS